MQGLDLIEVAAMRYRCRSCLVNCLYTVQRRRSSIFVHSSFIDRVSEIMEDTEGTEQQYEWSREGEQVQALCLYHYNYRHGTLPSSEPVPNAFFIHSFIGVQ
jgi:hypothetical protein